MNDNYTNKAPKAPRCINCARPMQLLRRTSRFDGLPDLCTLSVGAAVIADFDRIGLDHLDGQRGDGAGARLVRASR